jgi:hypothetical protein
MSEYPQCSSACLAWREDSESQRCVARGQTHQELLMGCRFFVDKRDIPMVSEPRQYLSKGLLTVTSSPSCAGEGGECGC